MALTIIFSGCSASSAFGVRRDAGLAGQRRGEQQIPGHARALGLFTQRGEVAQFLGQLVDAEHRFQRAAGIFLEALALGLGGVLGQFGADEDEQQALGFALMARGSQQLIEGGKRHGQGSG